MANLNAGAVVTYSIDPSIVTSQSKLDIEQVGSMADANFTTTFVAAIQAACTASAGKYTFDGIKTLTIVTGTTTPLTWTRTVTGSNPPVGATHGYKMTNGVGVLFHEQTFLLAQGAPTIPVLPKLKGANVSGMEFQSGSTTTPLFTPSFANIDIYSSRGFNVIRLPMWWSRLQHDLYGALDIVGNGTGDAEKYKALVDYITVTKGMYCIIDPHEGNKWHGSDLNLGSSALPVNAFEDFLIKLINYLGPTNNKIIINLANEPRNVGTPQQWMLKARSMTAAIRSTGSIQHIQVPGQGFTGAHSWVSEGNGAAMLQFTDPVNNYCFEVHQYLDSDYSGRAPTCVVDYGSTKLTAFMNWCTTNGKRGFVGEFAGGVSSEPQCTTEVGAMIDTMNASALFTGWAAWGGGAYWVDNYMFRIETPGGGADNAYMNLLKSKL